MPSVALAGATGNLGPAILTSLLSASIPTTVLTRPSSASKIPSGPTIREVDYTSHESLVVALQGIDVVVSNLGFTDLFTNQKALIDAAVEAGVKRFIPSEFGSDTANPLVRKLPVFADKVKVQEYLESVVEKNPGFSYTYLYTNSFLDWQLSIGLIVNLKEHTATLYDGGDVPFSATRLSTVGKAVVSIVKDHLEDSENRNLYVHDTVLTQKKLIEIAKRIDGEEWTTTELATADAEKSSYELLNSGDLVKIANSPYGFIFRATWGEGYGGDYTHKNNNELLGIPTLSDEELNKFVEGIIKS